MKFCNNIGELAQFIFNVILWFIAFYIPCFLSNL